MNILKINKIMNLILIVLVVYSLFTFVNQQATLNSYKEDISRYSTQIEQLKEKEEELLATQANVNSEEYIEKVAREELDMYLPNEIIFIDISK